MKKILLSMTAIAAFWTMSAQQLILAPMPQARETKDVKFSVSPSYSIMLYSEGTSSMLGITLGYNITSGLRAGLLTNIQLLGDSHSCFGIAAMLGTTELYRSPYTHSFTELSFGVGYQRFTTNYGWWDGNNYYEPYITDSGLFFPIRFKWGYSLTGNIDFGLDTMLALTTIEGYPLMGSIGLFFAVKF